MRERPIPLRVVLGLLLLAAAPRRLPGFGFVGPVGWRGAPAPAAAHTAPPRGFFLHRGIRSASGLLGPPAGAPDGRGLPAAGLQADLDLSEAGQQAGAAHGDGVEPRLASSLSPGSLSPSSLLLPPSFSLSSALLTTSPHPSVRCVSKCPVTSSSAQLGHWIQMFHRSRTSKEGLFLDTGRFHVFKCAAL